MHGIFEFKRHVKRDQRAIIVVLQFPVVGQRFENGRRMHGHANVRIRLQDDARNVFFAPQIESHGQLSVKFVAAETCQNAAGRAPGQKLFVGGNFFGEKKTMSEKTRSVAREM